MSENARDVLDEIIVRALAAQQDFTENCFQSDRPRVEPKSEDVVTEIIAALAAAGLAVVPVEPTEEMIAAGQGCLNVADEDPHGIWCNMLSEAPGVAGTDLPKQWWDWWERA